MKVSKVEATLSSEDILSIVNDFVKIDGLNLRQINIGDDLEIKGEFKKILSVKFTLTASIEKVESNNIDLKIKAIKVFKVGVFKPIKKLGMKMALKGFKEQGIEVNGENLIINISTILKSVPFIDLCLENVSIEAGNIKAKVENIDFNLSKLKAEDKVVVSEVQKSTLTGDMKEVAEEKIKDDLYIETLQVERIKDGYAEGRAVIKNKIPQKVKAYSDYLFLVPDILALIYRLFKDKRVNVKTKAALGASLGYIALPLDIIPDKLPFIGSIDDLSVVFFALNRIIEEVPMEVILENWQGKNHFVVVLKHTVEFLTKFTGAKNVDKIYTFIDDMVMA